MHFFSYSSMVPPALVYFNASLKSCSCKKIIPATSLNVALFPIAGSASHSLILAIADSYNNNNDKFTRNWTNWREIEKDEKLGPLNRVMRNRERAISRLEEEWERNRWFRRWRTVTDRERCSNGERECRVRWYRRERDWKLRCCWLQLGKRRGRSCCGGWRGDLVSPLMDLDWI